MLDGTIDEQRTRELTERHAKERQKWKAWDDFLESKTNAGFRQSSWYAFFSAAYTGWGRFNALLRDGGELVGGGVVFRRGVNSEICYYYMPDGPALSESDSSAGQEQVFRTIMEFVDTKRQNEGRAVSHLCIIPQWECVPAFAESFQKSNHYYGIPRDTQYIDLTPPESAILGQMKPKGRYNIGVARRYGVSIVEDASPQGIEDFIKIYNATIHRKNLTRKDPDYFRTFVPMLSASGRGSVFFAQYQGERLAAAIVVYFGRMATYFQGGSLPVHRNVMAPYLLQFEIMRKAKALGYRCYDLMGVTPAGEPSDGWTDISIFKRKFGGREVRLVPALDYVYDPAAYEEWQSVERERRIEETRRDREASQRAGNVDVCLALPPPSQAEAGPAVAWRMPPTPTDAPTTAASTDTA